jgi:hypothetical protein
MSVKLQDIRPGLDPAPRRKPHPGMHEQPQLLRERRVGATRASPSDALWRRPWFRSVATAVTVGVFLGVLGPFGSFAAPLAVRLPYWVFVIVMGDLFGLASAWAVDRAGLLEERLWARAAVITLLTAILTTVLVWAVTPVVFGNGQPYHALAEYFLPVLLISAGVIVLGHFASSRPRETHAHLEPGGGPAPVRFLERLPPKLRGGELYAVEAEDHYLRLHTSRGSDLILMRLSDAVSELDGLEGAQTHRSWWVAKDAVTGARRSDGRATLTLKSGAEAPVSRSYARALREAGWF